MRHIWIAFVVVLLDQAFKWFLTTGHISAIPSTAGALRLELITAAPLTSATALASLSNSGPLFLLASLLAVHTLISRLSDRSYFISLSTLIALQLGGGGIIAHAVDLVLRGEVYSPLALHIGSGFNFDAGIADIALLIGFLMLAYALLRNSIKHRSRVSLAASDLVPLRFGPLPRGIDNIHIDVHLSPHFNESLSLLIQHMLPMVLHHLQQGPSKFSLPAQYISRAKNDFDELLTLSLRKARDSGEKQLPDLFFISVLKTVHEKVNNAVAALVRQSKESGGTINIRGANQRNNPRLVEWLFRHRANIVAFTCLNLLEALCDRRGSNLEKNIKTFFDKNTLFTLQAMRSPALLSSSPNDERIQMEHYLLLGQQQNDANSFVNIDQLLANTFQDYLELAETPTEESGDGINNLLGQNEVSSNTIDTLTRQSVLMNPRNINILLDHNWTERKLKKSLQQGEWLRYNQYRLHLKFQQHLWNKVKHDILEAGLSPWIIAAYQTQELLRKSYASPVVIMNLLARHPGKQEFALKLRETLKNLRNGPSEESLIQAWREVHQGGKSLDRYLLRFLEDFSRYRRGLLLLLTYQRAANEINLLTEAKDIETSRANYTLYEFLHSSEARNTNAPILSHIIIKADLRGSTEVTEKLTDMELNPATHFERNFFVPINEVIDSYGAEKVFIEGDAIILILNEFGGENRDRFLAGRACGLAARILQIVAKQNRELAIYGLPQLELGIGITYQAGAPRYLFDKHHRITISPAINRADRLSASTWSVRKWRSTQDVPTNYIEVYQPSDAALEHGEKAQKDVIYNINGINLEESVFKRLANEQSLKMVNNTLSEIPLSELFTSRFSDLSGTEHNLVIRKAPVHIYDPKFKVADCPVVENRFFYEVIYKPEILDRLRRRR